MSRSTVVVFCNAPCCDRGCGAFCATSSCPLPSRLMSMCSIKPVRMKQHRDGNCLSETLICLGILRGHFAVTSGVRMKSIKPLTPPPFSPPYFFSIRERTEIPFVPASSPSCFSCMQMNFEISASLNSFPCIQISIRYISGSFISSKSGHRCGGHKRRLSDWSMATEMQS